MNRALLSICLSALTLLAGGFVPAPPQGPDGSIAGDVHLVFVGDVMLGRYVGSGLRDGNYDAPFTNITPFLSRADLAIANLEGPLVPPATLPIPASSPKDRKSTRLNSSHIL